MNKNVIVIGGGPAGLEASNQLTQMGYNVILVEKNDKLGGHLAQWDRLFPAGIKAEEVLNNLIQKNNGTKYFLGTVVNSINLLDKEYNVILSNGITVLAKAVLLASGFDIFPAEKKEEYGYGIYDHVITNVDLENYFKRGKDNRIVGSPKSIGFVHCVGSRDEKIGNMHCSKVCCATAVKQACEMKEQYPDANIYCFYMDLRMFGRHYEDLYLKAQKDCGIRFIRGRVSEVAEGLDKRLIIKAEDTLSGKPIQVTLDLLVLMSGMKNCATGETTAKMISLDFDDDGFFSVKDSVYAVQESSRSGVFYAGACTGPKTLPETFSEARAAAVAIDNYIKKAQ
jgi:heterodisulfide reductase subunit A2